MLAVLLTLPVLGAGLAQAAPHRPASGADVVEVLPWRGDARQRELRRLGASLAAEPRKLGRAAELARHYIAAGRREADPRYFGYAQAALSPWWNMADPPPEVRLLRASLLQSEHRFDAALADLEAVTRRQPDNAQAWLTRAAIETVRADYPAARRSCARLAALAAPLVAAGCAANVGAVTGQLLASERLLAGLFARDGGSDPAVDGWIAISLAEMAARRGDTATAQGRFSRAMDLAPGDAYLLAAYADFLMDGGRHEDAIRLLTPHKGVDGLLLRSALALQASRPASAELKDARAELAARFDAAARRSDGVHLRDHARYRLGLLGDAPGALALARRNWDSQREPADARVLLEAALAANDAPAARSVLDWMRGSGVEDVHLRRLASRLKG
ncbi:tetratricopeptide repeat protein [Massilia sp. DD77]|uniref:tetratricopeptide repeat protein n=1 Tax=Massilia sp. DD77 TaxID=3109349 RepID=UPI003000BB27